MRSPRTHRQTGQASGFTLPAILVVTGALLILAVGILLVAGIERGTARSYVDRQRAALAARAALEDIRGILEKEAGNDDFIVLQSTLAAPITKNRDRAPFLFLARGKVADSKYKFRYVPLFSSASEKAAPAETDKLDAPKPEDFLNTDDKARIRFSTLPYLDKAQADWLPVRNSKGKTIARYAYWVEDLQAKVDPAIAGNLDGETQTHAREGHPFPAPGLDDPSTGKADQHALNQVALYAIDPTATEKDQAQLGGTLINRRKLLVSPGSLLAAAAVNPPLARDAAGHLLDPKARAVEESLVSGIQPYDEQPLIPFLPGIDPSVSGKPKLNLNRIVARGGKDAVEEMANFINKAYPAFEDRKGGFPDNYVKTLAANAIDYADKDNNCTLEDGQFRGIDNYPLTTEIALQVAYEGMSVVNGRQFLNFRIRLFAELHNPTNLDVSGKARLSYEVALKADSIGVGTGSPSFDSSELLDDSTTSHNLDKIGGRYWSKSTNFNLAPNEFRCHEFATVTYRLDQGNVAENPITANTPFSLREDKGESGCSLMWNDDIVERQQGMVRQQGFIYGVTNGKKTGGYLVGETDVLTKAHCPALLYQKPSSAAFYGNTGDPRVSHYMNRSRNTPLDENAYPDNASPNRRSVRLKLYKDDSPEKPKVYARMLPSEWPDGGHDATVGTWSPGDKDETLLTDPKFNFPYEPDAKYSAIQMISNRGFYYSPTELGRIFDPLMFAPTFANTADTTSFRSKSIMPVGETSWPDAKSGQASPLYGGGNSLRIGRPEHAAFNSDSEKQNRAVGLLDLFHCGKPAEGTTQATGPVVRIQGQVNVNTASRDALRALAAGALVMDPKLSKTTDTAHVLAPKMARPVVTLKLDAPKTALLADTIADAVISGRPYGSTSRIALARDSGGREVFGNRDLYPDAKNIQWTDAAAEEVFARVYQATSIRSRNFRVWIVAQSVAPADSVSSATQVLSEVRKSYTLIADLGERAQDGSIIPENINMRVISSNDF
jgi:type II secretory pathway pseudopilin PulG